MGAPVRDLPDAPECACATRQPGKPFPGVCLLQIDQDTPALVVKSVFATAAHAGYPPVSFMVRKLPPWDLPAP